MSGAVAWCTAQHASNLRQHFEEEFSGSVDSQEASKSEENVEWSLLGRRLLEVRCSSSKSPLAACVHVCMLEC